MQPRFLAEKLFSQFSSLRRGHRQWSDRLVTVHGHTARQAAEPDMVHVHLPAHLVICHLPYLLGDAGVLPPLGPLKGLETAL